MLGVKEGGTVAPEPAALLLLTLLLLVLGLPGRDGIAGREAGTAFTAAVERGEASGRFSVPPEI